MNWKNISNVSDDYMDHFPVFTHLSTSSGLIMNGYEPIHRNLAVELNLHFYCGRFGDDLEENENGLTCSMSKSIRTLIQLIENQYGFVHYQDGVEGFYFALEMNEEQGRWVYFICAGNNGQELVTGSRFEHIELLENESVQTQLKNWDDIFYQMVKKAKVGSYTSA